MTRTWVLVPLLSLGLQAIGEAQQPSLFEDLGSVLTPLDQAGDAVELGDVDGDGDLDILKGTGTDLVLLLGRGDGGFETSSHVLPTVSEWVHDFALGDVDLDGDLDIFVATGVLDWGQDRLWLNDGHGVFTDRTDLLPAVLGYTASVQLVDLDGDGDLDALGGHWWYGFAGPYLWLNDGLGGFQDASFLLPDIGPVGVLSVAAGDMDGDGDPDLLLGRGSPPQGGPGVGCVGFGPAQPVLLLNDGQASFVDASAQLPQLQRVTTAIAVGDIDGDGDLDAVLGNDGITDWNGDMLLVNDGSGVFQESPGGLPGAFEDTGHLAFADLDGDGDLDLVRGGDAPYCFGEITRGRMWHNDGGGGFTDAALPFDGLGQATDLEPGDVDGDGDLDLVVGTAEQVRVLLGDGTGAFLDVTGRGGLPEGAPGACAVGDLDGDGDADLLHGDRLLTNDGSGWFTASSGSLPAGSASSLAVEVADLDGDGDLDAVIGRDGGNEVWENDGAGGFERRTTGIPLDSGRTRAVALGDLDGDGDTDVVIGNYQAQNTLWLNVGSGVFADASGDLPQAADATRDLVLGDVDGDGDLDLVVANDELEANVLAWNDGSARFQSTSTQLPPTAHHTLTVELGDVDSDGDLDLLLGGGKAWNVGYGVPLWSWSAYEGLPELWLGDGEGSFSQAPLALPEDLPIRELALADANGDGHLDAVVAVPVSSDSSPWARQQTRLWLGDGAGGFVAAPESLADTSTRPWGFAAADVDDDGDVNLVDSSRVQHNLTRHLSRRSYPRIGYPIVLEVAGTPGEGWFLLSSRGTDRTSYGTLGTLLLDRAQLQRVDQGVLDAHGRALSSFEIPALPGLIDTTLYWQAFLGGQLRLTNREQATLNAF